MIFWTFILLLLKYLTFVSSLCSFGGGWQPEGKTGNRRCRAGKKYELRGLESRSPDSNGQFLSSSSISGSHWCSAVLLPIFVHNKTVSVRRSWWDYGLTLYSLILVSLLWLPASGSPGALTCSADSQLQARPHSANHLCTRLTGRQLSSIPHAKVEEGVGDNLLLPICVQTLDKSLFPLGPHLPHL